MDFKRKLEAAKAAYYSTKRTPSKLATDRVRDCLMAQIIALRIRLRSFNEETYTSFMAREGRIRVMFVPDYAEINLEPSDDLAELLTSMTALAESELREYAPQPLKIAIEARRKSRVKLEVVVKDA